MYRHIFNNRLNHIGPIFPTFYTRDTETKPDIILTNNRFFHNHLISSGGIGPSDHLTVKIIISIQPIRTQIPPYSDIKNTNWEEYKNILNRVPEINIEDGNIENINKNSQSYTSQYNKQKRKLHPLKHS